MEAFRSGTLFFWTIGNPRSQDQAGFRARAKLRLIIRNGTTLQKGSEVWLLLDKIYPEENWYMLLESFEELREWFSSYCKDHEFIMKGNGVVDFANFSRYLMWN
jgi:hypothetical protein